MAIDLLREALDHLQAAEPAPGARLYHGDAFELLQALPTGSIDLAFADPPYFLSNGGTTVSSGQRVAVDKGEWDESAGVRTDREFQRRWLRAVQRVLKPTGSLFVSGTHHNIFAVGWSMQEADWNILNTITWEKPNPPPNLGCRTLTHSTEFIIWAAPRVYQPMRHVFNDHEARDLYNEGKQLKDVWRMPAPNADEKAMGRHPAQKPIKLLERIITIASAPRAVVLDLFAGSSTTGVAAIRLGRRFIGAELDPNHYELSIRRLVDAQVCLTSGPP